MSSSSRTRAALGRSEWTGPGCWKGKQQGLPKASVEIIRDNHGLWTGSWHVEFACDMVATYWCGPAYGLANLRLSATRGDPYQDSATHPADDARRAGIECILKLAGDGKAAAEIDHLWQDLKMLSPSVQPPGYAKRYSTRLLENWPRAFTKPAPKPDFGTLLINKTKRMPLSVRRCQRHGNPFSTTPAHSRRSNHLPSRSSRNTCCLHDQVRFSTHPKVSDLVYIAAFAPDKGGIRSVANCEPSTRRSCAANFASQGRLSLP
jgi:hypothetical protein